MHVSVLPTDELVFLQIGDVVLGLIVIEFEKQPADVRAEEAFGNAVGIIVMIHMLVMAPMFARPHQDGIFKRAGAKNQAS